MLKKALLTAVIILFPVAANAVTITINTSNQRSAISPYIYGTNQIMTGTENLTLYRLGGNRATGYNWENNYSNAGSDSGHTSDTWFCSTNYGYGADCSSPGGLPRRFHQEALNAGMTSIITLQMAGYVSADASGTVTEAQVAPSTRWKQAVAKKGSAFAYPPNTADDYVYMDELVNYLVGQYGGASAANGVKFYSLDNEADLWDSTHPRIHPTPVFAAEWVNKSIELSKAVKDVDANAQVLGPVFFGIWSMRTDYPDWGSVGGGYSWFAAYYLDKLEAASAADGRRLLDVFDIHWYSEAREGLYPPFNYESGQCRVTENTCTSVSARISRMQAPRTLWDATYIENSSVGQWCQAQLPLIPKVQAAIDAYYPGTKIGFTEHGHGGGSDYSGGIAMADTLGIFGKYGVYMACMWKTAYGSFHSAAYKLFRNYNGANGTYGDTKVQCDTSDVFNVTSYASINGTDDSELHIILLNKASTAQAANVNITSGTQYDSVQAWGFGNTTSAITAMAAPSISGNTFAFSLPAYSANHFVLKRVGTPTNTPNWTATPTYTATPVLTATPSRTQTLTRTVSPTRTRTPYVTATPTRSPTPHGPISEVKAQPSNCNAYGAGCDKITFTGLPLYTRLRIYDVSGALVHKADVYTPGGIYSWYINKRERTRRMSGGIYPYVVINENNETVKGIVTIQR